MNKSNEKAGKSQSFQQQSTLLLSLSFLIFHFFDLSLRKFKKNMHIQKTIYFLLALLLTVSACTKQAEQPIFHSQLARIDSLLHTDSLQWKELNRGTIIKDNHLTKGIFHEDSIHIGTISVIIKEGVTYVSNGIIHPLDDTFEERGIKTKAHNPMFLLKHFPLESLTTEADSMYYTLLMSEAQVKDYIIRKGVMYDMHHHYLTTDSLIRKAAAYYDKHGNAEIKARAHFLLGFYLRMENRAEAVRELMTASHYAEQTDNKELLAVIYRFMGRELYYANVRQQSDSIFRLAEPLAIAQQDTMLWMESIYYPLTRHKIGRLNTRSGKTTFQQTLQQAALGMELAHTFRNKEYEGLFSLITANEYLDYQYKHEGYKEKALHYAKHAYPLVENGYKHETLAKAYIVMGYPDSAAIHLDHLYGKDWREKGSIHLWTNSTYNSSSHEEVATVEGILQKEWQRAEYEGFLARYKYLLIGITITAALFIGLLHLYHQKKYRRQSKLLQTQQKKQQLLHGILQENLQKKEKEIAHLQQELAQRQADEAEQKALAEQLSVANENRNILAKETLEHSPAYNKVQLIIADYRWKEESDHQLTDTDWQELIVSVNACYNNQLSQLTNQYALTERELSICCLLLLDIPVVHIARFIGYTRPIVYKAERSILKKMGYPYEKGYLRKLLKTL